MGACCWEREYNANKNAEPSIKTSPGTKWKADRELKRPFKIIITTPKIVINIPTVCKRLTRWRESKTKNTGPKMLIKDISVAEAV